MARKSHMLSKSAFDCSHVKSVKAWGILHGGGFAGRIVANYSDNPNGSVCVLTLIIHAGPLRIMPKTSGQAGGYGYDKFSAAMSNALSRAYSLRGDEVHHRYPSITEFSERERPEWDALKALKLDTLTPKQGGWLDMGGAGEGAVREFLEAHGYTTIEVL